MLEFVSLNSDLPHTLQIVQYTDICTAIYQSHILHVQDKLHSLPALLQSLKV